MVLDQVARDVDQSRAQRQCSRGGEWTKGAPAGLHAPALVLACAAHLSVGQRQQAQDDARYQADEAELGE
jgi:hypothetical protein